MSIKGIAGVLRHRWRCFRHPPAVVISRSGQLTPRPQVHVSIHGMNGLHGIFTFDADGQGEASATMYGKSLAHVAQMRLVDERKTVCGYKRCNIPDCSGCPF